MKKRMLSLICVLALCLGLLPVTALAAGEDAPDTLYVGNRQVISGTETTYWSTDPSTGNLTESNESGNWKTEATPMMTNEARVAAVMERVRARVQLRKQRRMAGVLVLAALAAGVMLALAAIAALIPVRAKEEL